MFRNYLKIAIRNIQRHRGYTLINITGLAIGLACCLVIMLYVFNELQFERIHENRDQIYRVAGELNMGGQKDRVAALLPPMGPFLKDEFPEIINSVRLFNYDGYMENAVFTHEKQRFTEPDFYFADPSVFDIFTLPLLRGDKADVFSAPYSLVMTSAAAQKYFGDDDPLGQTLTLNDEHEFTVTGILADIPRFTQIRSNIIAGSNSLEAMTGPNFHMWGKIGSPYTYLLVGENFNAGEFEAKLPDFLRRHMPPRFADMTHLFVQPLKDIYLKSDLKMELAPRGNIQYVYLFSALAVAILLIACFNFMNLATARSARRSVEIGLRKTLGAQRRQLIRQLISESLVLTLVATLFAVCLFEIGRRLFGNFMETELPFSYLQNFWFYPVIIGLVLVVGVLAGSYPAFYLSRFQPVDTIKGAVSIRSKAILRKILVVFQYAISIILIISTIIIYRQIHYARHKNLGFDKDYSLTIPLNDMAAKMQYPALKNSISQIPGVLNTSGAFSYPGGSGIIKAGTLPEGFRMEDQVPMQVIDSDYGLLDALGITLVAGRDFNPESGNDAAGAYILNQAAVNILGWDEAVGKRFSMPDMRNYGTFTEGEIIGVVQDFHMRSLHEKIEPAVIQINPGMIRSLVVRIRPEHIQQTLANIESQWNAIIKGQTFDYKFLNEAFDRFYRKEEKLGILLSAFAGLAIFVACLGLFGLASCTTEQRTREIGIRKVLGASVRGIIILLSAQFIWWVLAANLIAIPAAWFLMNKWLQHFAYHTEVAAWIFALATFVSLMIAVLTVGYQALRTATINPARSLKYE